MRVSPGAEAAQVFQSHSTACEVLCQVKNDKVYRKHLFWSIHRLLGTSQGGESRVPAGRNGNVDSGEPQVKPQRGAGTAGQRWAVPGSEAVPSPLRSPSNPLCAALSSVGSSPEHSRNTSRACQERVFREDFPAVLHQQRRALTCGVSEVLREQGKGRAPARPVWGHRVGGELWITRERETAQQLLSKPWLCSAG